MDAMNTALSSCENDDKAAGGVKKFMAVEQYDSVSFKIDMMLLDEHGDCNVARAAQGSVLVMARLQKSIRFQRISSLYFSTGILFWYWPYYDSTGPDCEAERVQSTERYQFMQFGGNTVKDTYVTPFFTSLKDELLALTFITRTSSTKVMNMLRLIHASKCAVHFRCFRKIPTSLESRMAPRCSCIIYMQ